MNEEVKITISVDAKNGAVSVAGMESAIKSLGLTTKEGDAIQKKFAATVEKTFGQSVKRGAVDTTRQAQTAMMDFSRVVQDAPYGIRGVANNIEQLAGSMTRMVQEAGGGKAALSAIAGALTGPAGILLAISVVSGALVAFGDDIAAFFRSSKYSIEDFKEVYDKLLVADPSKKVGQFILPEDAAQTQATIENLQAVLESYYETTQAVAIGGAGAASVSTRSIKEGFADQVVSTEALIDKFKDLKKEYDIAGTAADTLAETLAKTLTPLADVQDRLKRETEEAAEAKRKQAQAIREAEAAAKAEYDALVRLLEVNPENDGILIRLQAMSSETQIAEDRLEELRLKWLEIERVMAEEAENPIDLVTDADIRAMTSAVSDAFAVERENIRINQDLHDQAVDAYISGEKAKLDAVRSTTEAAFMQAKSAEDVGRAAVNAVKQVLAALLAEFIARNLVSLGPAALVIGPVIAAAAGAMFSQLVPGFAQGVSGYPGGVALVGERGPELVTLGRGANVLTNENTRAVVAGLGSIQAGGLGGANSEVLSELRSIKAAFMSKEFTLRGTDLRTSAARVDQFYKRAGIR